jgi:hypothetical protein
MKPISLLLILSVLILAACGGQEVVLTQPPTATATPVITSQPTRTPFGIVTRTPQIITRPTSVFQASPVVQATAVFQPTSMLPPTVVVINPPVATSAPVIVNPDGSNLRILQNGRGLSNGQAMNNGEFQVEGYCPLLNPAYNVAEDDVDWFCTYQGQRALTLRENHFTDICRRTYNSSTAVAQVVSSSQVPNERWRCFEYVVPPAPTPVRFPTLLQNGIGMSSGSAMNNGNFEVEGYCSAINPTYGVTRDDNFWYCTNNGQRILTLGVAEFDDICFRTYRVAGAFAQQESNPIPAFGWRCYAYLD